MSESAVTEARSQGEKASSERDALAQAIGEAVIAAGIAQPVPMTGPELILMLQSLTEGYLQAEKKNDQVTKELEKLKEHGRFRRYKVWIEKHQERMESLNQDVEDLLKANTKLAEENSQLAAEADKWKKSSLSWQRNNARKATLGARRMVAMDELRAERDQLANEVDRLNKLFVVHSDQLGKLGYENAKCAELIITEMTSQLAAAMEKVSYVENMGLRFGIMKTSDCPEGRLAHTWDEDSDHERMFREWSESIGLDVQVEKLTAELSAAKEALAAMQATKEEVFVDRTHEECADCALENVEPARCAGHPAGPVSCRDFKAVEADTGERTES